MRNEIHAALLGSLVAILRPLVRLLLQNGVPCRVIEELARGVYVDVAAKECGIPGRKLSDSRISILTGLNRKEVLRLKKTAVSYSTESTERYNRATRVISGWVRDPDFTVNGSPRPLLFNTGERSFADLAKRYSGDIPARAILDELLRVGAVERREDGTLIPVARAYIPQTRAVDKLNILGTDTADLITTIAKNISGEQPVPLFQRKVSYDNIPAEAVPEFREISSTQAQELLERLDGWLAARDRDQNPQQPGSGRRRVGMGIYFFEEDLENEERTRNSESSSQKR